MCPNKRNLVKPVRFDRHFLLKKFTFNIFQNQNPKVYVYLTQKGKEASFHVANNVLDMFLAIYLLGSQKTVLVALNCHFLLNV